MTKLINYIKWRILWLFFVCIRLILNFILYINLKFPKFINEIKYRYIKFLSNFAEISENSLKFESSRYMLGGLAGYSAVMLLFILSNDLNTYYYIALLIFSFGLVLLVSSLFFLLFIHFVFGTTTNIKFPSIFSNFEVYGSLIPAIGTFLIIFSHSKFIGIFFIFFVFISFLYFIIAVSQTFYLNKDKIPKKVINESVILNATSHYKYIQNCNIWIQSYRSKFISIDELCNLSLLEYILKIPKNKKKFEELVKLKIDGSIDEKEFEKRKIKLFVVPKDQNKLEKLKKWANIFNLKSE